MKLNNKGFALTSIIYMLIVLFLMILLLILANLAQRKVVLDKIKNDVKTNLNQGGLIAKNTYTVTFDPTIGQINQTSKQVTYNEPYGELPTPTREGYKFIGWRGKNLAPEINANNYIVDNYMNRTTSELISENGENFIRINGNPSTENIDTLWKIYNNKKIELNQGEYILSFDVRSQNSGLRQYIKKRENRQDGKTGIYVNETTNIDNMISSIESDYNFDNDGEWHHFTSKVTIPYDTHDALIAIGNDIPNLYGENSYIDIKNIQLERGDTATAYEPYQEYTSDTIVTRGENHTLYAMWKNNVENQYTIIYNGNGATSGTTSSSIHTYGEPQKLTPNGYEKTGYKFAGWSTSPDDTNIISDDNEYSYDNTEGSGYKNIKQYSIPAPFEEGEVYQLDVDVKGTGNLVTYFHGESGYKRAQAFNSYGTQEYSGDGHNVALLTDEWEHYRVRFTLTSTGDGNVVKYLLFRATAGNNVQFKNIRFYKVSSTSTAYVNKQTVQDLSTTPGDTITLYAIWQANE